MRQCVFKGPGGCVWTRWRFASRSLAMCISAGSIRNAWFLCPALEFFMTSRADRRPAATADVSRAGSLPGEWLAFPPATGLPARIRRRAAGDRRANSDPATLAGESTRIASLEPTPRACCERSGAWCRPEALPRKLPGQMMATFRILHFDGWATPQPGSRPDRAGSALPAKHQISTCPRFSHKGRRCPANCSRSRAA